jgi:hypothetical protein
MDQVLDALGAVHGAEILHRDIKPSNIMIESSAHGTKAYLLDFGISKRQGDTTGTAPDILFGTLPYMSPEQFTSRELDARTDLYSLGCVMAECFLGRPLFVGTQAEVRAAKEGILPDPVVTSLPGCPPRLNQLIARMVSRRREDRPESAERVRAELQEILQSEQSTETRTEPRGVVARSRARKVLFPSMLLAAACVAIVLFVSRIPSDGPLGPTSRSGEELLGDPIPGGQTVHEGDEAESDRMLGSEVPDPGAQEAEPTAPRSGARSAFVRVGFDRQDLRLGHARIVVRVDGRTCCDTMWSNGLVLPVPAGCPIEVAVSHQDFLQAPRPVVRTILAGRTDTLVLQVPPFRHLPP